MDRMIVSTKLDNLNKAGNASVTLREALGLDTTMPIWVETELEDIISKYTQKQFGESDLRELRTELSQLGFSDYYPVVIDRIVTLK